MKDSFGESRATEKRISLDTRLPSTCEEASAFCVQGYISMECRRYDACCSRMGGTRKPLNGPFGTARTGTLPWRAQCPPGHLLALDELSVSRRAAQSQLQLRGVVDTNCEPCSIGYWALWSLRSFAAAPRLPNPADMSFSLEHARPISWNCSVATARRFLPVGDSATVSLRFADLPAPHSWKRGNIEALLERSRPFVEGSSRLGHWRTHATVCYTHCRSAPALDNEELDRWHEKLSVSSSSNNPARWDR